MIYQRQEHLETKGKEKQIGYWKKIKDIVIMRKIYVKDKDTINEKNRWEWEHFMSTPI